MDSNCDKDDNSHGSSHGLPIPIVLLCAQSCDGSLILCIILSSHSNFYSLCIKPVLQTEKPRLRVVEQHGEVHRANY